MIYFGIDKKKTIFRILNLLSNRFDWFDTLRSISAIGLLVLFSNLQEDSTLHPRDISDLPYIGLQCQIPESPWISLEIWKMTIQALSHPLWFPMLCLAFTPILAFVLIGWEVKGQNTGISQ